VRRLCALVALTLQPAGCGDRAPAPVVIAQTAPAEASNGAAGGAVEVLVARDAAAALAALHDAISGGGDPSSLAAAYALRLGVKHDPDAVAAAIRRGAGSEDDLVAALCWRWLARGDLGAPPAFRGGKDADPAVAALAAAAFVRLGLTPPPPLAGALGLPEGVPADRDPPPPEARVELYTRAALPYDDGPLALAVAFVEARRERWAERGPGRDPRFAAAGLRAALVTAIDGDAAALARLEATPRVADPLYSGLAARLASPLAGTPLPLLRGAIVQGDPRIRIDALRALAIAARPPEAGDLGAAASALSSGDPATRVEAARTYLLLAARATE
jgi:hypothetical protein